MKRRRTPGWEDYGWGDIGPGMEDECRLCRGPVYPEEGFAAGLRCYLCAAAERQAKKYGLTIWRVNAILRAQGDACAICGESPGDAAIEGPSYWQIDHDHTCCSGCARCVRGLLCMPCNARGVAWYENLDEARRDWPRMNAYLSDPPAHRPEAQVQWLDLGRVRGREGSSSAAASDAFTTAMDRHQPSPSPEQ
ncbi:endonuclease domain-containing protein [Streptomyces sp. NPDC127061]|uniref:endonuclease domain-containing protein n=1 Tax=unclassified Streptomyces TaxID=2593676 RepID=UPI003642CC6B